MIKASFRLILAALAATVALTACTKEITPGQVDTDPKAPQTEGSRIIAVSFAPQSHTKTYLDADGLSPIFKEGDEILLYAESEGTDTPMKVDTCQVKVDSDGKTFITTDLEGELIAFYPVSAVKRVYSDKEDKEVMRVSIPSVQSGRFADANILTGEIDGDCNEVTLEPETSLLRFYVDKSIRVKSIKVTSPSNYINDDENSPTVTTVTAPEGKTLDEVTDDPGKRICYVAVAYEANIDSVKFEIETETQDKVEKITKVNGKFLRGKMYNVFIPYYIEVNVGTDLEPIYQKWAYCNVGAFLPEEAGDYFSWAEVAGHSPAGNVFTFPESNPDGDRYTGGWSASSCFAVCNTPYSVNNSYGKYNASDKLTGLESVDDAASVNWGDGWKMPTDTALRVLADAQRKWDGSKKGYFFGTENTVFFPVTGYGEDNILESEEQLGAYWSSVLSSEAIGGKDKAVYLLLKKPNSNAIVPDTFDIVGAGATADTDIYTTSAERYYGLPIRPIYDPAPEVVPEGALSGKFTINADGDQVYFSKGNLYCTRTDDGADGYTYSFAFEANQYDYRTINDGTIVGKCVIGGEEKDTTPENTSGLFQWNLDDVGEGKGYGAFTNGEVSKTTPATLDWGEAYNAQHAGENWTTLKISEWNYLTKTRKVNGDTDFGKTCQWVKYNGEWGLIIYCDGYDKTQYNTYATIPTDEFPEGCAFLPESNRRYGTNIFTNFHYYWLGEVNSADFGSYAYFNDTQVGVTNGVARATGLSVRLVTPVSSAGK